MTTYDDFYFTSNLTEYACPGFATSKCPPPRACARDSSTGRIYCCDHKDDGGPGSVCWALGTGELNEPCENGASDLQCRNGDYEWCCLYETEDCTRVREQTNVCWNKETSPLIGLSTDTLNDTYSSLSSAAPTARTWAFDLDSLFPSTSTSATTTPTETSSPPTSPDTESSSSSDSDSLSGGTIAGIVVGVVGAIAIVLVAIFFFLGKRRRQQQDLNTTTTTYTPAGTYPPVEMDNDTRRKEQLFEADGTAVKRVQQHPEELPAS
ncbi:hypothetical protein BJY01DRAFT_247451 [Aspergillus pseudoustus]|uniref:Mid2 domain-containing protein n=1 Tax=Aspergillus pseudoustus TaxID=1810923 RepID=A0ABR4K0U1_9EURO